MLVVVISDDVIVSHRCHNTNNFYQGLKPSLELFRHTNCPVPIQTGRGYQPMGSYSTGYGSYGSHGSHGHGDCCCCDGGLLGGGGPAAAAAAGAALGLLIAALIKAMARRRRRRELPFEGKQISSVELFMTGRNFFVLVLDYLIT